MIILLLIKIWKIIEGNMPFKFVGQNKYIIDSTFSRLSFKDKSDEPLIKSFASKLLRLGVDFIEMSKYTVLPALINKDIIIYRVEDIEDMRELSKENVKLILYSYKTDFDLCDIISYIENQNFNIIIELHMDEFLRVDAILQKTKLKCLYALRFKGMSHFDEALKGELIKVKARGYKIDLCFNDKLDLATASALEGLDYYDVITAAFNGGGDFTYTSLEEVILSLEVLYKVKVSLDSTILSKMSEEYTLLTGNNINSMKAIIGRDIFKYESGVHADGIEKNPETYEPYEPELVGQSRKLIIGKHSGSKAVIRKLKELDINIEDKEAINFILREIREMSIALKRGIKDEELISICSKLGLGEINDKDCGYDA